MARARGAGRYLDVIESQSAALELERGVIGLRTQQLDASADLIRAPGGSWTRGDMEPTEASVQVDIF
jgi:outer membrane protein TolC